MKFSPGFEQRALALCILNACIVHTALSTAPNSRVTVVTPSWRMTDLHFASQSVLLDCAQQYEDECLLSTRNQEEDTEAMWNEAGKMVTCLLAIVSVAQRFLLEICACLPG